MVFLAVTGVLRASVNVARSDLSARAAATSMKVGVMKPCQNTIFAPGGKEATDPVRR